MLMQSWPAEGYDNGATGWSASRPNDTGRSKGCWIPDHQSRFTRTTLHPTRHLTPTERSRRRAPIERGADPRQASLRKQSNRFELFLQLSRDARSTRGTNSIRGSKIVNEDRLTKSREYSNRLTMIIFYVYNMGGERRVFVYGNALTIILIFVTLHCYITLKNKGKIKIKFRALIPRRSHDDPTVPHGGV